jgi:type I restriction enzyme S subunit
VNQVVRRVAELAELINGHPFDSDDFTATGDVPLVRIRDLLGRTFQTFVPATAVPAGAWVRDGDVLIGMDGDFNVALWKRGPAALNQRVCLLRAKAGVDPRFLAYALPNRLKQINDLTYSTTVKHLSGGQVRAIRLHVPSAADQKRICDYLDDRLARADRLVAAQERLIELLRERRRVVTLRAVTKGVADEATLRPSEVDWIGDMPAHWTVARLKNSIEAVQTGVWGREADGGPDDVLCVRVADFDRPRLRVSGVVPTTRSVPESDRLPRLLAEGDLLIEKSGGTARNPVGFVAMYDGAPADAVFSNFIARLRLKPDHSSRYWLYAHAASYVFRITARSVKQTTGIQNLDVASYLNESFPYPPVAEQVAIAEYLDERLATLDALIDKTTQFIALARERRAALITAVVTGQIDVQRAA